MANYNSDVSDVRPDSGVSANISPKQLPIRGEKRIINAPIAPNDVNEVFNAQLGENAPDSFFDTGRTQLVDQKDFNATAALKPFVDYVVVRLYNRGLGGNGQPNGTPAVYRFLINPSQVVVNRSTIDAQTMARSGWQIGVWGEDSLNITLAGKTAGQYFAFGLTDRYQPFTESYRNLEQLQAVFENNGYWFEGEQAAEGSLATSFQRRVIKVHADVELIVGNFMWYGMFDSLTISQNAETPYLMDFNITFVAWKERYRQSSPGPDTIHNDVLRAHDYGAWKSTALAVKQATQSLGGATGVSLTPNTVESLVSPLPIISRAPITPISPAVEAAAAANLLPSVDPTANDSVPMDNVINRDSSNNFAFWNYELP